MDSDLSQANKGHGQLVKNCLDQVLVFLTTNCSDMFDNVKPVLMEYASKAETNQVQAKFFDTINIVLANRDQIETQFRKQIHKGFEEFTSAKAISYPLSLIESQEGEQLSMVDENTLEIYLALQSMIAKADSVCYQELYGLGKRFSMIQGGKPLKDTDIPGCPAHTVSSFYISVEDIGLDNDMLLILLFLFGKHVMDNVNTIYEHVNSTLIDAGIFPNLKLAPNRAAEDIRPPGEQNFPTVQGQNSLYSTPQGRSASGNPSASPQSLQDAVNTLTAATSGEPDSVATGHMHLAVAKQMFQSINHMLGTQRHQNPKFRSHPELTPGGDTSKLRDKPEVVGAIEEISPTRNEAVFQTKDEKGNLPQNIKLDSNLLLQVKEALISEREKLYTDLDQNTIPTADLDTIELVGMLFEEVLNEDALPNVAKALISHLHTPYLKVAVQDHDFMINHDHAARRLLDLMVKSGIRWIDEEQLRRGIFYPMQEIVNQVMNEFQSNVELFEESYKSLSQQVHDLEERAKVLEERNHEAARGRERLEGARQQAKSVIREHVGKEELIPILDRFLDSAWLDRLILMLLRDPKATQTKEWASAIKVIDAIVRINKAPQNEKIKRWLGANRTGIKHHIQSGLAALGDHHQPTCDAVFAFMDRCLEHDEITPELQKELEKPVENAEAHIEHRKKKEAVAPIQLTEEEKVHLNKLQSTQFGTWFEITDDNNEIRKLKLSWFSPITHKYMFVDRFGAQSYVTPVEKLAQDMHQGRAKIITQPKLAFVDRALKKIHSVLEKALGLQQPNLQEK